MGDAWICLCFGEEIARKGRRERMPKNQDGEKPASERLARWQVRLAGRSGCRRPSRVRRWPVDGAETVAAEGGRSMPRQRIECCHWSESANQQGYASLRQPRPRIECCHRSQSSNQQGYLRISETARYRQEQFRLVRCARVPLRQIQLQGNGECEMRHIGSESVRGRRMVRYR